MNSQKTKPELEEELYRLCCKGKAEEIWDWVLENCELKAVQVQAKVKPESGEKIAEIRNLFSPILNYFTVKDEKQELMKTYFDNKKKVNALDKIEMLEGKNLRINKPYNKIKTLLDELG